ncbi:hypothetical protein PSMK_31950 [Phycisphaera mikurensis NBRC 102666]|uniref:Prokaryotic-type class I peptide chain release factors domain-containing protein n=1 Tax=Phycisphaera mikurensis (strain NBRC 102666 / KCTC 22515 / FYK2301M01) TaxID=1142394 RepID=I0IJB6_PHYMF|nr:hypothetical protein PSMK_31950 [Phycisphaera mikurensis NBRC 102666]
MLAPGVAVPPGAVTEAAVRSGGPGGQNVNKVATKIVLTVDGTALLDALPRHAHARLIALAGTRWSAAGLVVAASEARGQLANRRAARLRVRELLVAALHRPTPRRPRTVSRRAKARRVEAKRRRGVLKRGRSDGGADA